MFSEQNMSDTSHSSHEPPNPPQRGGSSPQSCADKNQANSTLDAYPARPDISQIKRRGIWDLYFCGHYLRLKHGERGGKDYILIQLKRHRYKMTQRDLQEFLQITAAALSESLAKLEKEKLISRKPLKGDKRQLIISLTKHGKERVCELEERRAQFRENFFSALSEEECAELTRLLDKLVDSQISELSCTRQTLGCQSAEEHTAQTADGTTCLAST